MKWYSRPTFFVECVERSLTYYKSKLGFVEGPSYTHEGKLLLGQVEREDIKLLLSCQEPNKNGHGRFFIAMNLEDFVELKAEFERLGAPVEEGFWGSELMIVRDPDGNELFFPYP